MSKGSTRRVENRAAIEANWERTFGGPVFGPKTTETSALMASYRYSWRYTISGEQFEAARGGVEVPLVLEREK